MTKRQKAIILNIVQIKLVEYKWAQSIEREAGENSVAHWDALIEEIENAINALEAIDAY